jgi:endogenous inhibitor of DNA gyrase (YacG/DUF329 family)
MPQCPVCDSPVRLEATPSAPFCSERCRLIDLGRWLDEAYALPETRRTGDEDDEGEHPPAGADDEQA